MLQEITPTIEDSATDTQVRNSANIVIIEDNVTLIKLFRHYFKDDGYIINSYTSGSDFLKDVSDIRFMQETDILILDVDLKDMTAEDILIKLREIYPIKPAYIIIYTSHVETDYNLRFRELGADQYFDKSNGFDFLRVTMNNFLNQQNSIVTDLKYNASNRCIEFNNKSESLSRRENAVFSLLWQNDKKSISKRKLNVLALDLPADTYSRTLDMHISSLRKKLKNLDEKFSNSLDSDNNGNITVSF